MYDHSNIVYNVSFLNPPLIIADDIYDDYDVVEDDVDDDDVEPVVEDDVDDDVDPVIDDDAVIDDNVFDDAIVDDEGIDDADEGIIVDIAINAAG